MHNHNFLRPNCGVAKLENMNLQLASLSGCPHTEFTNKQEDKQGVVGYPNTHTPTHTHTESSVWALQLKVFRLVFNTYCDVGAAITIREKRSSAASARNTFCCEKHCILCGCSLNTQHGDWPRSSCSLRAFLWCCFFLKFISLSPSSCELADHKNVHLPLTVTNLE